MATRRCQRGGPGRFGSVPPPGPDVPPRFPGLPATVRGFGNGIVMPLAATPEASRAAGHQGWTGVVGMMDPVPYLWHSAHLVGPFPSFLWQSLHCLWKASWNEGVVPAASF